MIGDKKESDKFYMRQKYVNWLESEQLNYVQQSSDTFQMQIECGFLGIIQKLVVGKYVIYENRDTSNTYIFLHITFF
jgi:hypothetical protein